MPLQSKLFSGDQKLEAAARVDSAHITPGASGPHIAKIQQALNEVAGARLSTDGVYGPLTAATVAKFKQQHKPPILNFAGKIDNIVGIKTMAALDAELPKRGGGHLRLNFDFVVTSLDIVINFIGDAGANLRPADEAIPKAKLRLYNPIQDPKNRGLLRSVVDDSLLLRIAHSTTEIGPLKVAVFNKVLKIIRDAVNDGDPESRNLIEVDRIYILGSSSGGRNAIDFVGELFKNKLDTHFVAPIDASFFPGDTKTEPNSPGRVLNTPVFTLSAAAGSFAGVVNRVKNRHNFFQTQGNHRKEGLLQDSFTSNMAGGLEEIHGQVEGFVQHRLIIDDTFKSLTDDQLHDQADPTGRDEAQRMIASDLTQ